MARFDVAGLLPPHSGLEIVLRARTQVRRRT